MGNWEQRTQWCSMVATLWRCWWGEGELSRSAEGWPYRAWDLHLGYLPYPLTTFFGEAATITILMILSKICQLSQSWEENKASGAHGGTFISRGDLSWIACSPHLRKVFKNNTLYVITLIMFKHDLFLLCHSPGAFIQNIVYPPPEKWNLQRNQCQS